MWACGHGDQSDKAWWQGKWNLPCVHHVFMPLWSRIHVHSCYMFYFGSLYWVPLKVRTLETCRFFSLQSDLSFFLVFQRFTTVSVFFHDSFCARASRCKWQTLGIVWIGFQCLASSEFTWVDSVCSLSLRVSLSAWRVLHGDVGLDAGAIWLQVWCYDAFHSCLIRLMFHLQSSFMKRHFLHIARDVLWVQYHFQASHNRKSWGGHCGIRIPGFGRHLDNEATWAHSPATLNHHTRSLIGSTLSLISF